MLHGSPFRTTTLQCPRCRTIELTRGPLHHCPRCQGTWIEEATLHERVEAMRSGAPGELVWSVTPAFQPLPCAACQAPMETIELCDVPIDRCADHGVWFDRHELAAVLERSATPEQKQAIASAVVAGTPQESVTGAMGLDVAAEAVVGGLDAVGVVGSVAEVVVDVIGAVVSAIDL